MEFVITEYKHCDLLSISGRVDSYTSPRIEDALNALLADGHCNIVIDLKDVSYLSSSGMLTFINALKQCKQANKGRIVLTNVSERVMSSLKLAGFNRLFDIYDDTITAIGMF
jgi:anti-sigma B factor antagonist